MVEWMLLLGVAAAAAIGCLCGHVHIVGAQGRCRFVEWVVTALFAAGMVQL